jgi:soluble lytic murein transglycosylase-like protein
MEKRHKKTVARTLSWATHGAKVALVSFLFLPVLFTVSPGLLVLRSLSAHPVPGEIIEVDLPLAEAPRPKELVKIYSILKNHRRDISEAEAWKVSAVIRQEATRYGIDPILVLAVIQVESRFKYDAVSPVGARGIMQIMPYVAKGLVESGVHREYSYGFRPEYLDDPVFNIKLGVYYLHDLKKSFRHLHTALIAYNLGPTELRNRLDNEIEYSDEYAAAVLSMYQKYKRAKPATF